MGELDFDAFEERLLCEQSAEFVAINQQSSIRNDGGWTETDVSNVKQAKF